jgi:hypothetical protein
MSAAGRRRHARRGQSHSGGHASAADDGPGYGWVLFAGAMLMMLGVLNIIEGIAAVSNSRFFVGNATYIFGSLNTWGWIMLCLGALQLLAGLGVFVKNQFARWGGVLVLGLNAIAQLVFIRAYPFWALSIFAIDVLAMFGLVVYGGATAADRAQHGPEVAAP